jgi:hypothetical protein
LPAGGNPIAVNKYHMVYHICFLNKNIKIKIFKSIILPVVLYGCETWSLIVREEQGLRVFEDRLLGKIFGPTTEKVTGEWRRLHS